MARWPVLRLPQPPGPVSDPGPGSGGPPGVGLRPFDRRVIWVGGVVFAVLMALSPRYGFHRDELYFLDAARHLQASLLAMLPPGGGKSRCHAARIASA